MRAQNSPLAESLWKSLLEQHPADIAEILTTLDRDSFQQLFERLPKEVELEVFRELSDSMKVFCLSFMPDADRVDALGELPADEMTDIFALLSDEELKAYLSLLHKNVRNKIIALMQFAPESAGGIMDIDVMTLMHDFSVEQSIQLFQRLNPRIDVHRRIFVIDRTHKLVGYINLEDLLVHKPKDRIASFMRSNEVVIEAQLDREAVAKQMIHYDVMTAPVIDEELHFLGAISSDTLVDVIVQEATEDVQKMAALAPLKHSYFETSFWKILWGRSYILIVLLLVESFSGFILDAYESSISKFLLFFLPMLISAGGNTSSQTSAIVIQGMATGDIHEGNMHRFLRREMIMAALLACALGITAFARVYMMGDTSTLEAFAISIALAILVMAAVILGSCIPILLQRFNIDPAFSAGPFLATVLDIFGVLIYCYVLKWLLF
jgi:magnesium transporter